jgi:hypothetical protein
MYSLLYDLAHLVPLLWFFLYLITNWTIAPQPWFLFIHHFNFKSLYLISYSLFYQKFNSQYLTQTPIKCFLHPWSNIIFHSISNPHNLFYDSIHHQHLRLIINNGSWSSNLKLHHLSNLSTIILTLRHP